MENFAKEIMLLRHGNAILDSSYTDYQRPLSLAGMEHCRQIGTALLREKCFPQSILSSPAKRTQQSSQMVCEQLLIPPDDIRYDDVLYLASVDVYLDSIKRFSPKYRRILLVGHNLGLEDLLITLTGQPGQIVEPATLLVLSFNGEWKDISPGQCQLVKRFDGSAL